MKKTAKSIFITAFLMLVAFGSVTYTSCTKDACAGVSCQNGGTCSGGTCSCPTGYTGTNCETAVITNIQLNNTTYTPIIITVSGVNTTIPVGSYVTYSGTPGNALDFTAYTYGTSSTGAQLGEKITWNTSNTFPASGTSSVDLYVLPTYFFLKVQDNDASYAGNGIYVNYGLTEQTFDNVTVPNTGIVYNIGYYLAYTNTEVYIPYGSSGNWWFLYPVFSFTNNQDVIMTLP